MADPPWYSQSQIDEWRTEGRVSGLEDHVTKVEERLVKLENLVVRAVDQLTTIMQALPMMLREETHSSSVAGSSQKKPEVSDFTNVSVAGPSNNQENIAGLAAALVSQQQQLVNWQDQPEEEPMWQAMGFPWFITYEPECPLEELGRRHRDGPWNDDDKEAWNKMKKEDGHDPESLRQEWFAEKIWLPLKKLLELRWPHVLWAFFLHPRKL